MILAAVEYFVMKGQKFNSISINNDEFWVNIYLLSSHLVSVMEEKNNPESCQSSSLLCLNHILNFCLTEFKATIKARGDC